MSRRHPLQRFNKKYFYGDEFVEDKLGKIGFSRREELYIGTATRRKSRSTNYGVGFDAPAIIQVCGRVAILFNKNCNYE